MTKPDHSSVWADAMRRARTIRPDRIASAILASADSGLQATRYDRDGGRTSRVPCSEPERCDDGPGDHSHLAHPDPTGNAAVSTRPDSDSDDLRRLNRASIEFVDAACVVLDFVKGERPDTWQAVIATNARLMPGTVQAGLDVDDDYRLPPAIKRVERTVATVAAIARDHLPRTPTQDEQFWTAGLSDESCCSWHLEIHRRYRRPRVPGTNACQDCLSLAQLLGQKPPRWLLEAEVDREAKPKAWTAALGRCMDELGVSREQSA